MRLTILATCSLTFIAAVARADDAPLYQQEPYDTITLDVANKSAELRVRPLDLPDRIVPANPNPTDELEIRLLDRPRKAYKVAWQNIAKVTLFEQRVLDEAERLVEAKKLDEAFPFYDYLQRRYPKTTGLAESYNKYLMAGATEAYKAGKYEECFALSWELYRRDPENKRAATAIRSSADKLIARRFEQADFVTARMLLQEASERLKDRAEPLTTNWNDKLHAQAVALVAEAKVKIAAKRFSEASQAVRQALAAWPEVEGGKELAAAIQSHYPEVVVGVTALADQASPPDGSWAARRDGRLLARSIAEAVRIGADGNAYDFPLAKVNRASGGRTIELTINPQVHSSDGRRLTGSDLTRALLAQGDSGQPLFRSEWRELVTGVKPADANQVDVELKQPLGHFESLLETSVGLEHGSTDSGSPSFGPYRLAAADDKETRFTAVAGYFAAGPKQPQQITERLYPDTASALLALRRGEVTVVDRIGPWAAAGLADSGPIAVEPYGISTLHVLVPNVRRPLMNNPTFRRAVAHAVDRSGILIEQLSRGKLPPGCELADGLFNRPVQAAAEFRFDAGAAKVLAGFSFAEMQLSARASGESAAIPAELILALPPDEVARQACQAIAQQMKAAGLPLRLKELSASELASGAPDADLIYVEWTPLDPVAELPGLIGSQGLGGDAGPFVERRMREALSASSDQTAERIARLEDAIRQQTLAIPLWRLSNLIAYRRELTGVGKSPVTLYQNVEQWNLTTAGKGE